MVGRRGRRSCRPRGDAGAETRGQVIHYTSSAEVAESGFRKGGQTSSAK